LFWSTRSTNQKLVIMDSWESVLYPTKMKMLGFEETTWKKPNRLFVFRVGYLSSHRGILLDNSMSASADIELSKSIMLLSIPAPRQSESCLEIRVNSDISKDPSK